MYAHVSKKASIVGTGGLQNHPIPQSPHTMPKFPRKSTGERSISVATGIDNHFLKLNPGPWRSRDHVAVKDLNNNTTTTTMLPKKNKIRY